MAVTSTTIGGVNVWQFAGAVTDAEIQAAWSALVVSGVYVINRAIYLDNTANLTGVTGGFLVDFGTQVEPAFILHTGRDKTKSTFKNFTFLQRTGLIVSARVAMVKTWNGTTLSNQGANLGIDGLSQSGGGFVYGVPGNPGGADPRYLNEMAFTGIEGATIYSQEFTEQELQICVSASTQLKGLTFEKCYGFPQVGTPSASVNVTVYRSTQNTQSTSNGGLIPLRLFPSSSRYAAVCYVDSYITRNNADINTRLIDTFGSSATSPASVTILNNYTKESWFGAAKTVMPITTWAATNVIYGGVLKKLQFVNGDGGVVRCYDSRSTTTAQKCAFSETGFIDFVNTNLAPTTDASGKISLVHIGAIATGSTAAITRYTGQKYTFQKFGYRVLVGTPDMTAGDNDLSAFSPVTLTVQDGITRTQAAINASTALTSFQDLLEELHVLAIALTGADSYNAYSGGNLFAFTGGVLTTAFTSVVVDATAASKISYNAATNALTIKSTTLVGNATVTKWSNTAGTISLANGAAIQGLYSSSAGNSTTWQATGLLSGTDASLCIWDASNTTILYINNPSSTQSLYIAPGVTGTYYGSVRKYGKKPQYFSFAANAGTLVSFAANYIDDVGASETNYTTVMAYAAIDDNNKLYDRAMAFGITEQGMKLGDIVVRSGTALDWGAYSGKVKATASSVFNVTGLLVTIKSGSLAPTSKYSTIIATPPATWTADTTEVITTNIEDGNGDSSIDIKASGVSTFEIWKITNATPPDDYATGTLVATVGTGNWRFLHADGYKVVIRDQTTNFRVVETMSKGVYTAALFFGDAVQLAQAPEVTQINTKVTILQNDIDAIKGTGFATASNSLKAITTAVGTPLQASGYTAPDNAGIAALGTSVAAVPGAVRTELATELGRVDVAISTRSTLTAGDIPAGLTAAEVWANPERTLTTAAGLTPEQAAKLDAIDTNVQALPEDVVQALGGEIIPVNLVKVGGTAITGTGTPENPWGPAP